MAGGAREALRRGADYPITQEEGPQKGILIAVPLFHVSGTTSFSVNDSVILTTNSELTRHQMLATFSGMKIVLARKWVPEEGWSLTLLVPWSLC
jgi:hypothetical protein